MHNEQQIYYMVIDEQSAGPFSLEEVAAHPQLNPETLVWKPGIENWVPAKDLPELAESRFSSNSRRYNSMRLSRQMYECFLTFELFCLFTILTGFAGGTLCIAPVSIAMALTGLVFLGRGISLHVLQFGYVEGEYTLLFDLFKDAIAFIGVCLTFIFFQSSALKELVSGFYMFLNGVVLDEMGTRAILGALYEQIFYPFSFFILLIRFFVFSHEYLPHCMRKRDILPRIRKVLVFSAGIVIFHLIAVCLLMGRFDIFALSNWFALVRKSYLPLTVLYSVLLWLESHYKSKRQIT